MKKWTRALALLLSVVTVLSMAISATPAAFAADVNGEEDTYVLLRYNTGDYTGPNMQYASPYSADYVYTTYDLSTFIQPALYSMYNNKSGEVIPVYCMDINVGAYGGHTYRRLNLEDASYASSVSNRIRAIVRHGFYIDPSNYASESEHEAAINAQISALGVAAGVQDLTIGEAISATQCAIWQVVHGSALSFPNFARTSVNKSMTSVEYGNLCKKELIDPVMFQYGITQYLGTLNAEMAGKVRNNISAVYNYLLSLEPEAATAQSVSAASFTRLNAPVLSPNDDGTYDVSVTATVDVELHSGDDLDLTASLDNAYTAATEVTNGKHTYELTLRNVHAEQANKKVYLTLSGNQTVSSDVFLFDAEGDRGTSQTMVGMDNSRLPVYARVVAAQSRVLRITKTTESGYPLGGIIFDIYPDMTMDEYLNSGTELPEPQAPSGLPEYTVITDQNGYASLDFTQMGLPDGVYLLVERDHPAIVSPLDPFYLIIPATNSSGTGLDYEVEIFPKNAVKGDVDIEKDVISLGNDEASVDAAVPHTWILTTSIPEDLGSGTSYVVSDTLDNRLDFEGNVRVQLESTDGETVAAVLTANEDYTLDVTDADSLSQGNPSDSFTLDLTRNGMSKIAAAVGTANTAGFRLRVYFDARINANAAVVTAIPNQAELDYVNSVNVSFHKQSDIPVVYTGGANLKKVDADDGHALAGAVFEVYRTATQEELAANGENLTTLPGVAGKVVPVFFFDNAEMEGTPVTSVTSDSEGAIAIYGLAYGNYYLVETQAPAGYNALGDPIELTVNETSHLEEAVHTVRNVKGTVLPETGGPGTGLYTFTGSVLMAAAAMLLLARKRKVQF